jgi:benzoyl-CoA-dihydrodiol lyase
MEPQGFETHPSRYRHWSLEVRPPLAVLGMRVEETAGLRPDYLLKSNSYDLGVDLELADALQRVRFEHPEVHALIVTSLRDRIFCAGANIPMLGSSSHPFKVNFCKYTNETRLALEELGSASGIATLAALNGTASGGGYELALACDEILLVDDGSAAVSLPEVPLLGVLPGTGGLTRLVEKRKVRRDLADVVATIAEGVRGKRALDWGLVDELVPRSRFDERVAERARRLASRSDRPATGPGIELRPLELRVEPNLLEYRSVQVEIDRDRRQATLTVLAPRAAEPTEPEEWLRAGSEAWALQAWREVDDALLRLRFHEAEIAVVWIRTVGDPYRVLAVDEALHRHRNHWLAREILLHQRRVLRRLEATAKTFFARIEPGSAFAGSLFELALAADRSYLLAARSSPPAVFLSPANGGVLAAANGRSRLESRFAGNPAVLERVLAHGGPFVGEEAEAAGLVTFALDEIDWQDEIRLAAEERAAMNPDALTGMETNLRFLGPETLETRIFGRLSAWQNWIFARPNARGERGSLRLFGRAGQRPEFDPRRT